MEADFARAIFYGRADFHGATFSGEVAFTRTTFNGKADFSGSTFQKANFPEATFKEADFSLSTFQDVDFSRVTFQEISFEWATFQEAYFVFATFQEVDFRWATFQEANFVNATFQEANFLDATFQEVSFLGATFHEAKFSWAKINGRVMFAEIRSGEQAKKNQSWLADLQFIQFGEKGVLKLEDLSLARVLFTGTNLRRVELDRVTWASWWGRTAVFDEILLHQRRWAHIAYVLNYGWLWGKRIPGEIEKDIPKKPSYADFAPVERLYRQLKANYEEERDFKRVGDFHYGEMEMHRRSNPWRQWLPFSWHNLYRVLSGYGERPLRAFIWLMLLIPAWAGLVWGLGIDQAGAQTQTNYWDTLLFIFEKATLQRPLWTDIQNINWLGKLLASLSVLLLPGQAALFLLALRNRLGRRR